LYNHALFSSLLFGCVGRPCLLNVAIPDMHISPFLTYLLWKVKKRRSGCSHLAEGLIKAVETYPLKITRVNGSMHIARPITASKRIPGQSLCLVCNLESLCHNVNSERHTWSERDLSSFLLRFLPRQTHCNLHQDTYCYIRRLLHY
jgi:hypothetical protein